MQQMMKQAQQMQERLQKEMSALRVDATSGGCSVAVTINGDKQLLSLKIDPDAVSKEHVEILQEMIIAAVNDAHRKVEDALRQKMGGMLPPGLKL